LNDDLDARLEAARIAYYAAEDEKRQAEYDVKRRQNAAIFAAHESRMATATGLRRKIMKLHAPRPNDLEQPTCAGCPEGCCGDTSFPCQTYELAGSAE